MRLIDADKLKIRNVSADYWYTVMGVTEDDIDNAPTVKAIPIEWLKNKRDELEKEYYDLFHAYTDESKNNQVWLLNNFRAFNTVLRYWEKENDR